MEPLRLSQNELSWIGLETAPQNNEIH